ncbi:MAG: hypothetical protein EA422_02715 [Gemmatimonadales bacterium]|nr:MAG: hypothetical protein EA422_02715 [Gemmatimonadales bacterium]
MSSWSRLCPRTAYILPMVGALLCLLATPGAGQQYVVDDAVIVSPRACQIEAWHGERASWILPACHLLPGLELSIGAGFVNGAGLDRTPEYALEAKTLLRDAAVDGWGIGMVLGVGPNPSADADQRRFGDIYLFSPATLPLLQGRLVVHGNLGWRWDRQTIPGATDRRSGEAHHLTWGLRTDMSLSPLISLLVEGYGEDTERPKVQMGFRTHFPDAGMEVDWSWGRTLGRSGEGPGFSLGVSLVSGPLF